MFSVFYSGIMAQNRDAALWENIYLEKKITPRIKIHLNHEGRITNNITQFYYGYADMGVTYRLNKNFHVCLDYVFLEKYLDKSGASYRHQFYIAPTYKRKVNNFTFSLREMLQAQVQDIYSSETGSIPVWFLRNKLTVKYDIKRFTPYVASELYVKLSEPNPINPEKVKQPAGIQPNRVRYFAGCFYELNKVNYVEVYYLIENFFNMYYPRTNFVIGIGYAHEFY